MPKKSSKQSEEKISLAVSGVASVDKALTVLQLFNSKCSTLSLMDMAQSTGLYKSTILRLLASLENAGLVLKKSQGEYVLGTTIATLNAAYQAADPLEVITPPILQNLMQITHESAAFYVRKGQQRLCLFRVDSNQALRDHIQVGDLLPLDRGAGGKVLLAFEGVSGKLFKQIRQDMVLAISGDRVKEISGISSPVFNANGLAGVITLTMPTYRMNEKHVAIVKEHAQEMTQALGGIFAPAQ